MDKAEETSLDFLKKYTELRTVLDSLDVSALQYCLKPKTNKERIRKINAVIKDLRPLVKKYGGAPLTSDSNNECEPGLCYCYGVCVPYQCP
jgi:hypothetical protein